MILGSDRSAHEDWRFDLAGKSVRWLDHVRRFMRAAQPGSTATLRDLNTGEEHRSTITGAASDMCFVDALGDFIDRVMAVQDRTKAEILVPKRPYPTEQDMVALADIESVLADPENVSAKGFAASLDASAVSELLAGATLDVKVPYVRSLLDSQVALGILRITCDRAGVHPDDIGAAMKFVATKTEARLRLRVVPARGSRFEARMVPDSASDNLTGDPVFYAGR